MLNILMVKQGKTDTKDVSKAKKLPVFNIIY